MFAQVIELYLRSDVSTWINVGQADTILFQAYVFRVIFFFTRGIRNFPGQGTESELQLQPCWVL